MYKFLIPVVIFFNLNPAVLRAQKDSSFKTHVVYLEVGGAGFAYSVNYEYRLLISKGNIISGKFGGNFLGVNQNISGKKYPYFGTVLGLNYFLKKKRKYITFNISQFILHGFHSDHDIPFIGFEYYTYYNVGWAWSKFEKKSDLRINGGVLTDYKIIYPWAGFSFGIKF